MKYWIDTEFHEEPGILHPISVGIVAEDGREWYAVLNPRDRFGVDYLSWDRCNDWVKQNVLTKEALADPRAREGSQLFGSDPTGFPYLRYHRRKDMADHILKFIGDDKPEFWGYFSDYDWVVFCQLFGRMLDLPKGWPRYCLDLKQIMHLTGVSRSQLPEAFKPEHNALVDARWTRAAWHKVQVEAQKNALDAP